MHLFNNAVIGPELCSSFSLETSGRARLSLDGWCWIAQAKHPTGIDPFPQSVPYPRPGGWVCGEFLLALLRPYPCPAGRTAPPHPPLQSLESRCTPVRTRQFDMNCSLIVSRVLFFISSVHCTLLAKAWPWSFPWPLCPQRSVKAHWPIFYEL